MLYSTVPAPVPFEVDDEEIMSLLSVERTPLLSPSRINLTLVELIRIPSEFMVVVVVPEVDVRVFVPRFTGDFITIFPDEFKLRFPVEVMSFDPIVSVPVVVIVPLPR